LQCSFAFYVDNVLLDSLHVYAFNFSVVRFSFCLPFPYFYFARVLFCQRGTGLSAVFILLISLVFLWYFPAIMLFPYRIRCLLLMFGVFSAHCLWAGIFVHTFIFVHNSYMTVGPGVFIVFRLPCTWSICAFSIIITYIMFGVFCPLNRYICSSVYVCS
jgi:hypothetical protein